MMPRSTNDADTHPGAPWHAPGNEVPAGRPGPHLGAAGGADDSGAAPRPALGPAFRGDRGPVPAVDDAVVAAAVDGPLWLAWARWLAWAAWVTAEPAAPARWRFYAALAAVVVVVCLGGR